MDRGAGRALAGGAVEVKFEGEICGEIGFDASAEFAPGVGSVAGGGTADARNRDGEAGMHVCKTRGLSINGTESQFRSMISAFSRKENNVATMA